MLSLREFRRPSVPLPRIVRIVQHVGPLIEADAPAEEIIAAIAEIDPDIRLADLLAALAA